MVQTVQLLIALYKKGGLSAIFVYLLKHNVVSIFLSCLYLAQFLLVVSPVKIDNVTFVCNVWTNSTCHFCVFRGTPPPPPRQYLCRKAIPLPPVLVSPPFTGRIHRNPFPEQI